MQITLTELATTELKSLMTREVESNNLNEDAGLRLMVVGGGCSGFTYKMGFDENISEKDKVEVIGGVKIVVDEKSALYLDAVEVDFQDSLMGRGFVFNNPNASGTCGCGSSFSI
ncbi:MAG: iron-sulfur cluster assembly accessory protein [Planctomycetota bacterium]|nr:iron-sulfur cluster assembly accessory protein [Planctomycetota bacterium]